MIQPLRDRLVIEPLDEPLSTVIHVVEAKERNSRGRVLAVGPKVKWGTKVDDIVHFTDIFRFPVIMDQGAKRLIIQEADVMFVEERELAA